MSKDTGGSAFPEVYSSQNDDRVMVEVYSAGGMTLRDYFAAKALTTCSDDAAQNLTREEIAEWCYLMADAMLAERNK